LQSLRFDNACLAYNVSSILRFEEVSLEHLVFLGVFATFSLKLVQPSLRLDLETDTFACLLLFGVRSLADDSF